MSDMHDDITGDELRKRLQQFEEHPGDALWDKIASGVENAPPSIEERLRNFASAPDDGVWEDIATAMRLQRIQIGLERFGQVMSLAALLLLMYTVMPGRFSPREESTSQNRAQPTVPLTRFDSTSITATETTSRGDNSARDVQRAEVERAQRKRPGPGPVVMPAITHKENAADLPVDRQLSQVDFSDSSMAAYSTYTETAIISDQALSFATTKPADTLATDTLWNAVTQNLQMDSVVTDSVMTEKKKKRRRVPTGFYALLMPTLGYQQVTPLKDDDVIVQGLEKISTFSFRRLGVRAEAGYEKQLTRKITLQAGLLYFQRKQTIGYYYADPSDFEVVVENPDSMSYVIVPTEKFSTFEYEVKNVGAIAGLNYQVNGRRHYHRIGLAAELHRALSTKGRMEGAPQMFLFGDLYYRLNVRLGQRTDFLFQPTLNYSLQVDDRLTAPFYVKPYGFGLNFGLYYHF